MPYLVDFHQQIAIYKWFNLECDRTVEGKINNKIP